VSLLEELPTALRDAIADRYVLETQAGSGGMAFVYRARDVRHNRNVALKVLRPYLSASLGPDRFKREIDIAARLQHPNILPVFDSGEAAGALYYVMPFIEGGSLRAHLIERGTLLGELDVDMIETSDGFVAEFCHRPAIFAGTMVEALMRDYAFVLRSFLDAPDAPVGKLEQGLRCA